MTNKLWVNLQKNFGSAGKFISKYSPEILIGCGIASFIGSVVVTAKNAPKAKEALDVLHEELADSTEELTKSKIMWKEFKTAAPYYIPSAVMAATGTACVLGSYKISTKRTAALATAYELSQTSMQEYRNKVIEKFGAKKEGDVRNAIMQDHVNDNPPEEEMCVDTYQCRENEVLLTDGKVLWYDAIGGRYFRASQSEVDKAIKWASDRLPVEMWISLNDLYFELGLPQTIAGDELGFTTVTGIDLSDNNCVKAPNGTTACVLDFLARPVPGYRSLY